MTEPEKEPYILTPEEETEALNFEASRLRQWRKWKLEQAGLSLPEIAKRLSEINFADRVDRDYILHRANMNKGYKIWEAQQRQKDRDAYVDKQTELRKDWTAERMQQHMADVSLQKFGKKLIINDDNRQLIKTLCYFLSRDPRFETELNFSTNKGLLLRGVSGLGKTYLLDCLADNPLNPIACISMVEVEETIRRKGGYDIKNAMKGKNILDLDDVGTEEPVIKYYGTNINFFKDFIEQLYLKERAFNRLIITTNHSFAMIEEKYGARVRSRMKDIFNVVDVTGTDMRGKS